MLFRSFDIDDGGGGHPIGFVGIMELHDGVMDFAAKVVEAKIVETGFEGGDEFDNGAGFAFDPDVSGERKWIIATTQLNGSGRRRARDRLEMNFDEGAAINNFFAERLEDIAGFVILVEDE